MILKVKSHHVDEQQTGVMQAIGLSRESCPVSNTSLDIGMVLLHVAEFSKYHPKMAKTAQSQHHSAISQRTSSRV
eukprot:m.41660 g.41660  ORF g.41660 m.41660 type:complete len:75 (-) comp10596_c0_seq1:3208-3432(-)